MNNRICSSRPEIRTSVYTTFFAERRAFDRLKSDCSKEAQFEYEEAVSILIERYNTTIYENRFIVGGAIEVFTCALLRSVGLDCTLYGDQAKSGDILLPNNRKLSIKSAFTGGPANIKLINQQGEGNRTWDTATLFVLADVGIVFGAPDMVFETDVRSTGDGLMLQRSALKILIEDVNNVFEMQIPQKPPTEMTGFSYKASAAVAKQIFFEMKSDKLQKLVMSNIR